MVNFIYILYLFLQRIVYCILKPFVIISTNPKFKDFVTERSQSHFNATLSQISRKLTPNSKIFWVHVASAGELEQAIPVLRYINAKSQTQFFVTYFSPSAKPFLKNVPGLIGATSLPLDSIKIHTRILKALHIKHILFVRYDVWPGILLAARKMHIPLSLLAATRARARSKFLKNMEFDSRKFYFHYFKNIFAALEDDVPYFKKCAPGSNVVYAGDPKWIRAKERVETLKTNGLSENLSTFAKLVSVHKFKLQKMCFVFGSPHAEEHQIALECAQLSSQPLIIYVPDVITPERISEIKKEFLKVRSNVTSFSELQTVFKDLKHEPLNFEDTSKKQSIMEKSFHSDVVFNSHTIEQSCVVILDTMGTLAEIYALADVAIVGGGFDGQIHNTLEPAAHPVPVVFGAQLFRSPEAQRLVQTNSAKSFDSPAKLFEFLSQCSTLRTTPSASPQVGPELATMKLRALELFANVPNTNAVIFGYLI